jgi:hypothetical protein
VGTKALVALDTDHIKQYVFATDKLKEIRGASSLLDRFNRDTMGRLAWEMDKDALTIYTAGGSGFFLLDAGRAGEFLARVRQECGTMTGGGATVTGVIQPLPSNAPGTISEILAFPLPATLEVLRARLRAAKETPPELLALPSHPFLRPCQACGVLYAEGEDRSGRE